VHTLTLLPAIPFEGNIVNQQPASKASHCERSEANLVSQAEPKTKQFPVNPQSFLARFCPFHKIASAELVASEAKQSLYHLAMTCTPSRFYQ
jgi:hypothetical protein